MIRWEGDTLLKKRLEELDDHETLRRELELLKTNRAWGFMREVMTEKRDDLKERMVSEIKNEEKTLLHNRNYTMIKMFDSMLEMVEHIGRMTK